MFLLTGVKGLWKVFMETFRYKNKGGEFMKKLILPIIFLALGALIVLAIVFWPDISNWFVTTWNNLFNKEAVETTANLMKLI